MWSLLSRPHMTPKLFIMNQGGRNYSLEEGGNCFTYCSVKGSVLAPRSKSPGVWFVQLRDIPTFWKGWSDWIRYPVHIVGPGTSFAISALVRPAILLISLEVRSCSTPATMLDGEKNHLPFSGNLIAFVDGIGSSLVGSTDSRI